MLPFKQKNQTPLHSGTVFHLHGWCLEEGGVEGKVPHLEWKQGARCCVETDLISNFS